MEIFERVKIRPRGFKIEKEKDMEKKEGSVTYLFVVPFVFCLFLFPSCVRR